IYRQRLWDLLAGFGKPSNRDYALKLGVAFGITAVLGVLVKKLGFELPDQMTPIAWALILGGVWMVVAEYFAGKRAQALGERSDISWTVAVLVGVAQVVAGVFPGTSRSAATIFVALLAGTTNRAAATEFAFLVGIPTMFAATAYELLDVVKS
ncbi:undecaprenyl-diphosphate phosphatase, partial [Escherichia coli]|uniref:undecaprenyl-diphosphate phosphatase n=1 Tax=Escherichia coli TaxID=562 RepID=UPI002795C888